MGIIICSFNLNILLKMSSYCELECDIIVIDFVIENFAIRKGVICAGPCIQNSNPERTQ